MKILRVLKVSSFIQNFRKQLEIKKGPSVEQKEFVYQSTFRTLMKDGDLFAQQQAEDLSKKAVQLWSQGRPYKDVLKTVIKEQKKSSN